MLFYNYICKENTYETDETTRKRLLDFIPKGRQQMKESSKHIKEKIRDFCFENDYPVFFADQIEKHGNTLILTRSDGLKITYSIIVKPTMINDDSTIHLETKLTETIHRTSLNNSVSF